MFVAGVMSLISFVAVKVPISRFGSSGRRLYTSCQAVEPRNDNSFGCRRTTFPLFLRRDVIHWDIRTLNGRHVSGIGDFAPWARYPRPTFGLGMYLHRLYK